MARKPAVKKVNSPKPEKPRAEVLRERAKQLIKNHVRLISMRWPYAAESDARFRVARGEYECANEPGKCISGLPDRRLRGPRWIFKRDHIEPVVDPAVGYPGWVVYFERALPGVEGYQLLCRRCHEAKTKRENEERYARKRAAKLAGDGQGGSEG